MAVGYMTPQDLAPYNMLGVAPSVGASAPLNAAVNNLAQGNNMGLGGQGPGSFDGIDLGWNVDTLKTVLGGLQAIGGIWQAFQNHQLAKNMFNYQKDITERNYANQLASYNTALADRARARGAAEGQTQAQIDDYINRNRLG